MPAQFAPAEAEPGRLVEQPSPNQQNLVSDHLGHPVHIARYKRVRHFMGWPNKPLCETSLVGY